MLCIVLIQTILRKSVELEPLSSYDKVIMKYLCIIVREQLRDLSKDYDKSENDLKALQSVGQV